MSLEVMLAFRHVDLSIAAVFESEWIGKQGKTRKSQRRKHPERHLARKLPLCFSCLIKHLPPVATDHLRALINTRSRLHTVEIREQSQA